MKTTEQSPFYVTEEDLALALVGLHPLQIAWDKERNDDVTGSN